MKQGNSLVTLVIVLLAVMLAAYLGVYAWDSFTDPFTTTLTYSYTANDSLEADGWVVREEQLLPAQSGILDITRAEGEEVGRGQTVALVHQNSQALDVQAQMEELAMEIELLDYAMNQTDDVVSAARLDESILQSLASLRFASASGSYRQLDDDVMELKSQVLKRSYTYGEGLDSSQLSALRQSLIEEYRALRTQSSSVTSRITAPAAGVFSSLADGYESLLTPQSILTMTPADLDALMAISYGNGRTVQEEQQEMVLVIGENIKVRRFAFFTDGISVPYVHAGGKIGVLVNLETGLTAEQVETVGKDVAMQIAALNPRFWDKSQVDQATLDEEKKILLVQMENDPKMASKPEKVKEGIVAGKLGKFYKENCLLQQEFVKDNAMTVEQYIASVAKTLGGTITFKNAVRFEKGEGIEKKQENFAEEIAKQLGK